MGAAEARTLCQKTSVSRCFAVHEDSKMAPTPRLACCHQQRSSSGNTEKAAFLLEVLEIPLVIPTGGSTQGNIWI